MPTPLHFTFGNHMHWVDMQWLWGYDVLPGSVRDMLALCREAGVRGNVNFDGIGYEKMAAECPESLAALRDAVASGTIEPVGCSYGQPYGLFHGGESNARQLVYGAAAVRRLLGVWPRAFWEEEFYFFPQLPQLLAGAGFQSACLFFQWTWHTPELPSEDAALVLWEGIDGTRLPALPRGPLNVHQWPEDFDGVLERAANLPQPVIVQWLELMPSKDWMCRSELLLPKLKELAADARFELRPRTVSALVHELRRPDTPVRAYTPDDAWHGMTLGKNGDLHPRRSRQVEAAILEAEALAALASLLGRPYPSWDVYPAWELDEAWRQLLAAQHHDNHECEGLCGHVGHAQFDHAEDLARDVADRTRAHVAGRLAGKTPAPHADTPATRRVVFNPSGWARDIEVPDESGAGDVIVRDVPPFGYRCVDTASLDLRRRERARVSERDESITIMHPMGGRNLWVTVDQDRGMITQIGGEPFGKGVLAVGSPLLDLMMQVNRRPERLTYAEVSVQEPKGGSPWISIRRGVEDDEDAEIEIGVSLDEVVGGVRITLMPRGLPRPDPGMHAGLQMALTPAFSPRLLTDSPYAVHEVFASASRRRKYPEADWMTSPQWFEEIRRPLTGLNLVDLLDAEGRGLLVVHDGSQQFFANDRGVSCLLDCYDPWDEARDRPLESAMLLLVPHGPMTHAARAKLAGHVNTPTASEPGAPAKGSPHAFGPIEVIGAPGVLATAFFRDSAKSGEHKPRWAGHRMAEASAGACTHPFALRLVEWDGQPATVTLRVAGEVALAAKTNLLGEVGDDVPGTGWLQVKPAVGVAAGPGPDGRPTIWSDITLGLRAREVATVMLDVVPGRKAWRDLDAKREVWATVHRT